MKTRTAVVILSFCFVLLAADTESGWIELNHAAGQAIQAKDYAKLRETLLALKPLMPGNAPVIYRLAASDAKLGAAQAALDGLRNLAGMGLVYDFQGDADFSPLRGSSEFSAILKQVDDNKKPLSHSSAAFTLAERDLIPEDIAYDAKTRRFFVSSVRKSKIVVTGGARDQAEFAKTDWPVLALRVDSRRRFVWAATGWLPQCERCEASDKNKTALLAFDLDSGALKQRIESPVPGLLGDMTISRKGEIYVSEGIERSGTPFAAGSREIGAVGCSGRVPFPTNSGTFKRRKDAVRAGLRARHCGHHARDRRGDVAEAR